MNIYRSDKKSGGISNYPDLTNKPQINGIELNGNKTSADLGIITKAVDDLVNYYTKQQTYTKEEINTLVENVVSTRFEVVNSLPTTDIKTNVIYLVPSQNPSTAHAKDEWINLDGTTAGWEQIGSTNIDLSNYVTTSQLNSTLTNYVTTTALNTALASYITSTDLATALASYITSTDLSTALSSYISSSDLATALADYTTTSDLNDLLAEKQDAFQLPSMPTPTQDWATGTPFEYTGTTTNDYVHGYFYECKLVNGSYTWVNVKVQDGDTIQVAVMPTATADYVGKILQFTGATTQDYKQGYFYRCVNNNGTYSWVNQPVQDGEAIQYSTMPTASSTWVNKVVQFIGTTDNFYTNGYFYKCVDDNGTYRWVNVPTQDSETIQVTTMPTASVDNWKSIVQYIGATTSTYTNGYFYECVSDGQSTPTYSWVAKNVQKGGGGHTIEDSTGIALTQRDIMQFSDSFSVTDDSTNERTEIELNKLTSSEMDEIVSPLPSVNPKIQGYSVKAQTLTAGSTSVTFTGIPTSGNYMVSFYNSIGINYTSINTATAGQVTLTYDAQSYDVTVYCEIKEVVIDA